MDPAGIGIFLPWWGQSNLRYGGTHLVYVTIAGYDCVGTTAGSGNASGSNGMRKRVPVRLVDICVFDLDEHFVVTDFWDRLFFPQH